MNKTTGLPSESAEIYGLQAQGLPLAPLARAAQELLREGASANTRRSYAAAYRYWQAWHRARWQQELALPLSVDVVAQFIVDHVARTQAHGFKSELPSAVEERMRSEGVKAAPGIPALSTVVHRVAVLSRLHEAQRLPNPCRDPAIRALLSAARRAQAKRGLHARKKDALTREHLEALLATCDQSLAGKRDRALLLFAWASGGRRRSEVAEAELAALRRLGPKSYVYELRVSKTNAAGSERAENFKPIQGRAARALADWLDASGLKEGRIFRRIDRAGRLGPSLSSTAVANLVKKRCASAGLSGDFGAHSLRSGFVTEAARQSVPLAETMAMTGHRSVASVLGYFRAATLESRAARLLESEPEFE